MNNRAGAARPAAASPRRAEARSSRAGRGLVAAFSLVVLGGCASAAQSLQSDVLAPLSVLPATDVVLETNLQAASQVAQGDVAGGGGFEGFVSSAASAGTGVLVTTGAPSSPTEVSAGVASGNQALVLTAFNPLDKHCLGQVVIAGASSGPVLGESAPGVYDFWFNAPTPAPCTASAFAATSSVPTTWAHGDPATSWPNQ